MQHLLKRASQMCNAFSTTVCSMLEQKFTHKVTCWLIADPPYANSTNMPRLNKKHAISFEPMMRLWVIEHVEIENVLYLWKITILWLYITIQAWLFHKHSWGRSSVSAWVTELTNHNGVQSAATGFDRACSIQGVKKSTYNITLAHLVIDLLSNSLVCQYIVQVK